MQTGIDMYGQGRYPFYLEPAVIIVISDGGKLTTQGSVQGELILPMHSSVPGFELTREPFRYMSKLTQSSDIALGLKNGRLFYFNETCT